MGLLADLVLGALLEPEDQEKVRRLLQRREQDAPAKDSETIDTEGEGEDVP